MRGLGLVLRQEEGVGSASEVTRSYKPVSARPGKWDAQGGPRMEPLRARGVGSTL